MKRHIIPLYIATAALLALAGCTDEQLPGSVISNISFSPKGELVDAYLNLSVNGLSVTATTRANTVEDTDAERTINDLWVFQYDGKASNPTYDQLIASPQYVSIEDQATLVSVPVTLSDNNGDPSIIYVVANTANDTWVKDSNGSYTGFMTVDDLKANNIPTPKPQRMIYDYGTGTVVPYDNDGDLSIPMSGCSEETRISNGTTVKVDVERMFAKLCIQVNLTDFHVEGYYGATIYDVTVGNIPEYSTVNTLFTNENEPGDYSGCSQWITRAFNNNESGDNYDENVYPYVIYVPENIQGVNGDASKDKSENVPDANYSQDLDTEALSVTVEIKAFTTENNVTVGPSSFTVYPGGDEKTNFNVKRNCVYYITVTLSELEETALMTPSANCIVCLSSETEDITTAFFPYYRPEEGGGYKFINYLNYLYGDYTFTDDDDEQIEADITKRIDHVKIIWQSENSTGTGGYIGDNENNKLVWIDEAPATGTDEEKSTKEYSRKIYVKIPHGEIGNALIGAYNSTSDDPIWSWHIWTRNENDDPGNEANGVLYYTYRWDNYGIYYNESRIAGYTVMNCNLGALADVPASTTGTETYGTMYQWGRKDPFPPANTNSGNSSPYNSSIVGNYYDDNDKIVGMTEGTDSSSLFHSIEGQNRTKDIGTRCIDYINYSIHYPTVFICGTEEAGKDTNNTNAYVNSLSNYADPQDGNWIYDNSDDHYNSLWGGLDPEHNYTGKIYDIGLTDQMGNEVYLYDDYGDEKSIFDPCPYGWRVSPPDLWLGFTNTGKNPKELSDINYDIYENHGFYMYMDGWKGSAKTSFFPCQGTRLPEGSLHNRGTCGNYLNATSGDGDRVNILHLHNEVTMFHIFEAEYLYYYVKSMAGPVRCVRFGSVAK